MCAIESNLSEARRGDPAGGTEAPKRHFELALAELADALVAGKTEPICAAYLTLRRLEHGIEPGALLGRIERALGDQAPAAILSAFSRRHCFMCDRGTNPCHTCEGTGLVDRFRCPNCEGLGVEACMFCLSSGWSPLEDMPEELRPAVRRLRTAQLRKELDRLAALPMDRALASARKAGPEKRRDLARWLLRLLGRVNVLGNRQAERGPLPGAEEATRRANQLLGALRESVPTQE